MAQVLGIYPQSQQDDHTAALPFEFEHSAEHVMHSQIPVSTLSRNNDHVMRGFDGRVCPMVIRHRHEFERSNSSVLDMEKRYADAGFFTAL